MAVSVFLGIFLGIVVYAIGHSLITLCVEPIRQLREQIGKIAYYLTFLAGIYHNPDMRDEKKEEYDRAYGVLKNQASQLRGKASTIPYYPVWVLFKLVPRKKDIIEASRALTGLSNSINTKLDYKEISLLRNSGSM